MDLRGLGDRSGGMERDGKFLLNISKPFPWATPFTFIAIKPILSTPFFPPFSEWRKFFLFF
jgi:hypothetical protein